MKTTDNIETKTVSKAIANNIGEQQSRFPSVELIQPKLTIGQPNDKYEQEADQVATAVVNISDPIVGLSDGSTENTTVQNKSIGDSITPWIQTQEMEDEQMIQEKTEETTSPFLPETSEYVESTNIDLPFTPDLSTKTSVGSHTTDIQRQEEEEEIIQTKVQRLEMEDELQTKTQVQRKPYDFTATSTGNNESSSGNYSGSVYSFSSALPTFVDTNHVNKQIIQTKYNSQIPNGNKGSPLVQRKIQGYRIRDPSNTTSSIPIRTNLESSGNIRDGPVIVQRSGSLETQRGPPMNKGSTSIEQNLQSSAGGGTSMSEGTRTYMESRFSSDFSNVRIHTDQRANEMSNALHAQAFTHGNNIYFNQGKYNPDTSSGKHLLAHELTHTVQQGASSRSISPKSITESNHANSISSTGGNRIQRGWLDDAWSSVSGAVSGAVEWAADQLSAGIDWVKRQARSFVTAIPGYSLFTVVIGYDPISGESVDRSGRNFIEAGIDIIPGGAAFKQKLEEEGAITEAATWLDGEIAKLNLNPSQIGTQISNFFSGLSITDIADPGAVLQRLSNIITGPVQRVITFAVNVATKLLEIVKSYVINSLITFVREQTNAYPLLTVILGRDPISGEEVERTPSALLRGFMQLSESGQEQLRQMEESGSLQRAVDWLDGAVARLNITPEIIRESFSNAWDLVSIESLLNPIDAFRELYNIFAGPVGRIISFIIEVAVKVLKFIKDALIRRLVDYARSTRGYLLLTVILGKDPFSGERVERNTENLVHGFMVLQDGGEEQFQEMKQSGAIDRMSARIEAAVASLNFTWEYIRGLFVTAWESFSLSDLANPFAAFARIIGIFADPLWRLIVLVAEIIRIVIEVLLIMMSFPFNLIGSIINNVRQAIGDISRDPMGFLKNLMRAVKTGFVQFFDNILTHLLNGLVDWLFGELEEAGITPPTELSFSAILDLVLQVLGLSMERIWSKLADRIGQEKVDRVRGMIDRLSGIWSFVRDVQERGMVAIWEYIQGQLSNLWNIVLESIRNWIVTRIIQQVTAKLLSMLDPTGIMAVINGFIAFFNAVQSFIRYLTEMLEIVNSFVSGIAEIASGNIGRAANFLENSLARAVPIAIGFLANQVGLSGLGRRIGEMIERVREMVDQALDWLIDRAVTTGQNLLNTLMGRGAGDSENEESEEETRTNQELEGLGDLASIDEGFTETDGDQHHLKFRLNGGIPTLYIYSDPKDIFEYLNSDELDQNDPLVNDAHQLATEIRILAGSPSEENSSTLNSKTRELSEMMAEIRGGSLLLPSNPIYTYNSSNAKADQAKVELLSANRSGGTPPGNAFVKGWSAIQQGLTTGAGHWKRMHLINQSFGGFGTHENLVPGTVSNNSHTENNFDNPIKEKIGRSPNDVNFKREVVWIETNVTSYYSGDFETSLSVPLGGSNDELDNTGRVKKDNYARIISFASGDYEFSRESQSWVKNTAVTVNDSLEVPLPDWELLSTPIFSSASPTDLINAYLRSYPGATNSRNIFTSYIIGLIKNENMDRSNITSTLQRIIDNPDGGSRRANTVSILNQLQSILPKMVDDNNLAF